VNGSRGGLVLAGVLCGYGLLVVTYLESQEIRVSHDDAYINYVYARNLVGGDGLSFHLDERVWGYTSPAQVLLLTGLAGLGADLPRATPIAGFAFAGLCGLLSFGLIRRVIDAPLAAALGAFWLTTWSPLLALNVTLEGNFS
jgi:hypothetical protein